jgi:hypothetical protein
LSLGAAVASDWSTLVAPTLGGAATIAFTPGRLRLEAEGRRYASQSGSLGTSSAGASFAMTSAGGRACWAILRSRHVEGAPCLGSEVVFVDASGFGADANFEASARWATVTGGAAAALRVASWLSIRANIMAFVPLSRPTFIVENEGPLHRPPTLGTSASLGVEVHFF